MLPARKAPQVKQALLVLRGLPVKPVLLDRRVLLVKQVLPVLRALPV